MVTTKKDQSIRFCIDFRKLNELTEKDCQPNPRNEENFYMSSITKSEIHILIILTLSVNKWFTTL